jgi:hypothetical protein
MEHPARFFATDAIARQIATSSGTHRIVADGSNDGKRRSGRPHPIKAGANRRAPRS